MDSVFSYQNEAPSGNINGPLAGLKIAVQPTIGVAGWPAQAGSEALAGYSSPDDATVIARLRQGGAILAGLTHAGELGLGINNKSTAGRPTEAKITDAEVMLDLTGEARLSAARSNLWGFKPSWGLLPRTGIAGLIPSMEACGILARDPATIRAILETTAGADDRDFSQPALRYKVVNADEIKPGQLTLGIIKDATALLSGTKQEAFKEQMNELKKSGFQIRDLSWPDYRLCLTVHRLVGSVEASSAAGRYDSVRFGKRAPGARNWNEMYLQSRGAFFGTLIKSYLIQGAYFQFERYDAYENACRIRARLLIQVQHLFGQADVLVFPVQKPADTETLSDLYEQCKFTAHANVTGLPALHVPHVSADSPGIELQATHGDCGRVIALGEYLHRLRAGGRA